MYGNSKLIEYGGFYLSRFELGWENNRCVSRKGVQPATPSQNGAITTIKNSFIKTSYARTALIHETAYDMVMAFVNGKRTKGRSTFQCDCETELWSILYFVRFGSK